VTDSGAAAALAAPPQAGSQARGGAHRDAKDSVTASFISLQRTVRQAKARLQAAAGNDVESATHLLLHTVQADGPLRASALAASVQADLSTVSRQVNLLISRGLVERRADQLDGRASLLAVTDAGRAAIAQHETGRQAFFDEVLAGWSTAELDQFAQQLERFTTAYDQVHSALVRKKEGSKA
jgi:DNA-binding MarR family transcriptional regulator